MREEHRFVINGATRRVNMSAEDLIEISMRDAKSILEGMKALDIRSVRVEMLALSTDILQWQLKIETSKGYEDE